MSAVPPLRGRGDAPRVRMAHLGLGEPFREWVLAGDFPGGRPPWEEAGARFTGDVTPYERRKLWLLNGAHPTATPAGVPHRGAIAGPRHPARASPPHRSRHAPAGTAP